MKMEYNSRIGNRARWIKWRCQNFVRKFRSSCFCAYTEKIRPKMTQVIVKLPKFHLCRKSTLVRLTIVTRCRTRMLLFLYMAQKNGARDSLPSLKYTQSAVCICLCFVSFIHSFIRLFQTTRSIVKNRNWQTEQTDRQMYWNIVNRSIKAVPDITHELDSHSLTADVSVTSCCGEYLPHFDVILT